MSRKEQASQEAWDPATSDLLPVSMEPPALDTSYQQNLTTGIFCDWLLPLSIAFTRFTHTVAWISIPFLFVAK